MKTILRILAQAGGYHRELYTRIENPPFLPLVIEAIPDVGPCGCRCLSVAHYSEQNGDAMRDPEMCFELSSPLGLAPMLVPYYWRNDLLGVEQYSRRTEEGQYAFNPERFDEHEKFATLWDANLRRQDYFAAFERRHTQR